MLILGCSASAQSKFTDYVKSQRTGDGRVVIIQTPEIDDVVNNILPQKKKSLTPTATKTKLIETPNHESGKKINESPRQGKTNRMQNTENAGEHAYENDHIFNGTRQRYKTTGYRIQIFTGSNSHNDKMKAYSIGEACQRKFPMLSVYPRFINPRWVCRVGDFRTHEDAQQYARKIRAARVTTEVRIVRCEVLLAR